MEDNGVFTYDEMESYYESEIQIDETEILDRKERVDIKEEPVDADEGFENGSFNIRNSMDDCDDLDGTPIKLEKELKIETRNIKSEHSTKSKSSDADSLKNNYISVVVRIEKPVIKNGRKTSQWSFRTMHSCKLCQYTSYVLSRMTTHQLTHTGIKAFTCEKCAKPFAREYNLKMHMFTHSDLKPFACGQCSFTCNQSSNMKKHQLTHLGVKRYSCDVCPLSFLFFHQLKRHKMTHTRIKPFKCDVCSYTCYQAFQLKYHYRTHSGDKPYACDVCHCTFSQLPNLKRHRLLHDDKRRFLCVKCPYSANSKGHLTRHHTAAHGPISPVDESSELCYSSEEQDQEEMRQDMDEAETNFDHLQHSEKDSMLPQINDCNIDGDGESLVKLETPSAPAANNSADSDLVNCATPTQPTADMNHVIDSLVMYQDSTQPVTSSYCDGLPSQNYELSSQLITNLSDDSSLLDFNTTARL